MLGSLRHHARRRLASEAGFSLPELLISILILTIGVFALVSTVDGSRALSDSGQRNSTASHVAERKMEQLSARLYRYSQLAINANVAPDPNHPVNKYVCSPNTSGTPAPVYNTYRFDQTACSGGDPYGDELVVDTTNGVAPSEDWFDARTGARGTVHTFITWVDDACPNAPRTSGCAGNHDYKRITVAVRSTNGEPRTPVILSTIAYDPDGGPECVGCSNPYSTPALTY